MTKYLPLILTLLFTACSEGEGDRQQKPEKKNFQAPTVHEKNLQDFTGARTKIVWTQYQNPDKVDKQGTSRHHHLMAIDTANGIGERKVLKEKANYAFPIITPDGERIVFTRKVKIDKGSKRKFDVTIEVVNFDGSGLKTLGDGYAQEVWEDPETGKYWIYAGEEFVLAGGTAPICKRIIRFPIDDPSKRETVWDKTQMGTDSFAISADGKRFAGLFPWPAAGIGNLEKNDWKKISNGCWVSMAPDNSYESWVFDGPHKNLLMFDANGKQTASVPVNTHPALKGKETYHPRWGNHRQFFVQSGPHTSGKKKSGKPVEIFLGKFSPELDNVESWFQVTKNGLPDIYPDIWIENGSNSNKTTTSSTPVIATEQQEWPSNSEGLIFKWENINAKNEFTAPDGSNQVTKVEPNGFAHYGPNYEMIVGGGYFLPILDSDAFVKKMKRGSKEFGFQALVTMRSEVGSVFGLHGSGDLRLGLRPFSTLQFWDGSMQFSTSPSIELGKPAHIAFSVSDGKGSFFVNGIPADTVKTLNSTGVIARPYLKLGPDLDGSLEHIAFYNRPLTPDEIAADYAIIKTKLASRKSIERLKIKGKLVAMSELPDVDSIKPYVRALVYYAYETDHPTIKNLAVGHWAILDSEPVPGLPREIGKTYDLIVEPKDSHPELNSQAESNDDEQIDFRLPLYYDVAPLQ